MTDAAFYQLGPLREYLEDPTVFEIRIIKATPIGRMLDMSDIMRMLYSTIDVVVHMEKRKIKEIYFDPEYKMQCVNGSL